MTLGAKGGLLLTETGDAELIPTSDVAPVDTTVGFILKFSRTVCLGRRRCLRRLAGLLPVQLPSAAAAGADPPRTPHRVDLGHSTRHADQLSETRKAGSGDVRWMREEDIAFLQLNRVFLMAVLLMIMVME